MVSGSHSLEVRGEDRKVTPGFHTGKAWRRVIFKVSTDVEMTATEWTTDAWALSNRTLPHIRETPNKAKKQPTKQEGQSVNHICNEAGVQSTEGTDAIEQQQNPT